MKKRVEMAAKKGCDAIDPDNVDGFITASCVTWVTCNTAMLTPFSAKQQ